MSDLVSFGDSLDGEVVSPDSPAYEEIRRPVGFACREVRPRLVVLCRSTSDVVAAVAYARATGDRLVPRGGGRCFAGRSSTDGIVLDMSGLDDISVAADRVATIGAGARLGRMYAALHDYGLTLPAGCGPTVGIAGLTLGGGIGLLGRKYGLTCDRLVGAEVVLADGAVVDCDDDHEPDLFWGLRGAGGGQFGVVTSLRFDAVPEPVTTRIEAQWSDITLEGVVSAWQASAPDAPDELTVNLSVVSEPGAPVEATLFGASTLEEGPTRELLRDFVDRAGVAAGVDVGSGCGASIIGLRAGLPFHRLKASFADPRDAAPGGVIRTRSEFFSRSLADDTLRSLLRQLAEPRTSGRRELSFTAMGGAYNRVAQDATAFAHRSERFLLEHVAEVVDPPGDPWLDDPWLDDSWLDDSWATAHADGSGRVYPNFPDPALDDWPAAYHAGNHPRLAAVKNAYDPHRFFDFPQAI